MAIPCNPIEAMGLLFYECRRGGSDFSCQKPHKVGSGLKLAGAGVVAGTAALIAAPVIAAKEDGVTGFFKGLAPGVLRRRRLDSRRSRGRCHPSC